MKTISPSEHAARLKERQPASATYTQHDEGFIVRYSYRRPWPKMPPQEKCDVLALVAADMRRLAEQMETARLEIAQEELAA